MWARRAGLGLLAGLIGVGCSGSVAWVDGSYRDHRYDFRIGAPAGPGPTWQRVKVDDAALSFRRDTAGGRDTLSLVPRCGRPVAEAQIMARELVIGLDERHLQAAGPVSIAGRSGWTQTFRTGADAAPVRVKTVTLVVQDCSFDFVLAVSGQADDAEAAFDRWWQSFQLGARYAEGSG